ncbi:MAG TPA: hypothetical protein PLT76_00475 [Candidatus Omnitrophota bacterium]|nr:hypothetical protein [Candidatus Omnitrophota bacterium]HQO57185.1 hypothetical protein [Candidatus Omnitrophota bacterium]
MNTNNSSNVYPFHRKPFLFVSSFLFFVSLIIVINGISTLKELLLFFFNIVCLFFIYFYSELCIVTDCESINLCKFSNNSIKKIFVCLEWEKIEKVSTNNTNKKQYTIILGLNNFDQLKKICFSSDSLNNYHDLLTQIIKNVSSDRTDDNTKNCARLNSDRVERCQAREGDK